MPYNITASTFTANNFSNNINSSICLTNFLPAKKTCKKAVYTSHEVIRQRHKSHNLPNASLKHLLTQIKMRQVHSPTNPKMERRNFQRTFRSSIFRRASQGFKGSGTPLQVQDVPGQGASGAKWHAILRNLPIIPATIPAVFEGVWIRGKQPLKERCFSASAPKKSSKTSKGDDSGFVIFRRKWVSGKQCSILEDCFLPVHCRRKITRLLSSRPTPATTGGKQNALSSKMPA